MEELGFERGYSFRILVVFVAVFFCFFLLTRAALITSVRKSLSGQLLCWRWRQIGRAGKLFVLGTGTVEPLFSPSYSQASRTQSKVERGSGGTARMYIIECSYWHPHQNHIEVGGERSFAKER